MADLPTNGFDFSVPAASTLAAPLDTLFYALLAVCAVVTLLIVGLIVYFCVRYRRGNRTDRRDAEREAPALEYLWISVPLVVFLAVFFWSASLYQRILTPPPNTLDIFIVAKQWMWKVQQPNGRQEIDAVHVPLGVPVRLIMTSQDVIHSFSVPAFRLKQDVLPGRYTALWFEASKTGVFPLFCTEFCGTAHAQMVGSVVVLAAEQYQQWLADAATPPDELVAAGAALYQSLGCAACHDGAAGVAAPNLDHLFGSEVMLLDGRRERVDEAFVREMLIAPQRHAIAGYAQVMPSYQDTLDDSQLQQLARYLAARGASSHRPDPGEPHHD